MNILPASQSTARFFNAARFSLMKPGAIFYNIGRGSTVDQNALIQSLTAKRLAAAYLDVTDPEPLSSNDPLWSATHCFLTPHTGGGHVGEFERSVDHFLQNLNRFQSSIPLLDRVF